MGHRFSRIERIYADFFEIRLNPRSSPVHPRPDFDAFHQEFEFPNNFSVYQYSTTDSHSKVIKMKKILIVILTAVFVLTGCNSNQQNSSNDLTKLQS